MPRKHDTPTMPRPAPGQPVGEKAAELEQRIARLEERLDHSILGDDGLAQLDKKGIDDSASGVALRKAVRRSNARRGSRKA